MKDGAPCHKPALKGYLKEYNIKILLCPAQNPDMNPIEIVWSIIKGIIWKERYEINTKYDLMEKI